MRQPTKAELIEALEDLEEVILDCAELDTDAALKLDKAQDILARVRHAPFVSVRVSGVGTEAAGTT